MILTKEIFSPKDFLMEEIHGNDDNVQFYYDVVIDAREIAFPGRELKVSSLAHDAVSLPGTPIESKIMSAPMYFSEEITVLLRALGALMVLAPLILFSFYIYNETLLISVPLLLMFITGLFAFRLSYHVGRINHE